MLAKTLDVGLAEFAGASQDLMAEGTVAEEAAEIRGGHVLLLHQELEGIEGRDGRCVEAVMLGLPGFHEGQHHFEAVGERAVFGGVEHEAVHDGAHLLVIALGANRPDLKAGATGAGWFGG